STVGLSFVAASSSGLSRLARSARFAEGGGSSPANSGSDDGGWIARGQPSRCSRSQRPRIPHTGDALRDVVVVQTGMPKTSRLRSILVPLLHPIPFGRHKADAEEGLRRVVLEVPRDAREGLNRRDNGRESLQDLVAPDQAEDGRVVIDPPPPFTGR